jgi:hypothetical protein
MFRSFSWVILRRPRILVLVSELHTIKVDLYSSLSSWLALIHSTPCSLTGVYTYGLLRILLSHIFIRGSLLNIQGVF